MNIAASSALTRPARWLVVAAALAFALLVLAGQALAQTGSVEDFDLRPRAAPTPAAPVVGPQDPEDPAPPVRPRPAPTASAPAPVPTLAPAPTTTNTAPTPPAVRPRATADETPAPPVRAAPRPGSVTRSAAQSPLGELAPPAPSQPSAGAAQQPDGPRAAPPGPPRQRPYVPRRLDLVEDEGSDVPWGLVAALAGLVALSAGAWFVRSRRHAGSVRKPLAAPEIERPRVSPAPAAPPAPAPEPASAAPRSGDEAAAGDLPAVSLALHATRMSATLVYATLSYRLAVTNNGPVPLSGVSVAGDMIAAHASRPAEELLGASGIVLPELHTIPTLAPGERVELAGDIRLPLVAITPIRRGDAALFVPLARLRARGTAPDGALVEGGGTFLVGQEPGGNARLQPFRLDLGPRNYSRIGQHRLPVPA